MAIAAGVVFGVSLVLLTVFFRTQNLRADLIATWGFVVFAVLVVPVMLTVRDRIGADSLVVTGLTVAGILGAVALGVAEAATALKLIDFRRVSALATLGFVLFLVWIGGVSAIVVASASPALPVVLGWVGLASIVLGLAIIVWIVRKPGVMSGDTAPDGTAMTAFLLPLAGVVAWLAWLGLLL
jgi:hypothetical protein